MDASSEIEILHFLVLVLVVISATDFVTAWTLFCDVDTNVFHQSL